jgi:hypothetical protein
MPQSAKDLMQALLGKIYATVTGGDQNIPVAPDKYIAWFAPGLPFDSTDLRFMRQGIAGATGAEARELLSQAYDFSKLVDFVPDPSGIYTGQQQQATWEQTGETVSCVYSDVLQFSEVASGELTDEQKAKLEKFRNLLHTTKTVKNLVTDEESEVVEDGPVLAAYYAKMSDYLDALTEYNAKRLAALNSESSLAVQEWAINASTFRQRVKVAHNAWVASGYKNEVDQMNAYIDQVTQRDMTLLKERLQQQFTLGRLTEPNTGQDFHLTTVIPGNFAEQGRGWTTISFSESNFSSYHRTETTGWGASGGLSLGVFNIGGSAGGSTTKTLDQVDASNFSLKFSLTQVPISYPFDLAFLRRRVWRFKPGMDEILSDAGKPPTGRMVAYPTTAIFVKDVVLDFSELHDEQSTLTSELKAGGAVSYGPFVLGGNYSRKVGERRATSHMESDGLHVDGLQMIACKVALMPKSPDPNPNITEWA